MKRFFPRLSPGTFVSIRNQAERVSGVNDIMTVHKELQASARAPALARRGGSRRPGGGAHAPAPPPPT